MAHPPTVGGVRCPRGVARGFGGKGQSDQCIMGVVEG